MNLNENEFPQDNKNKNELIDNIIEEVKSEESQDVISEETATEEARKDIPVSNDSLDNEKYINEEDNNEETVYEENQFEITENSVLNVGENKKSSKVYAFTLAAVLIIGTILGAIWFNFRPDVNVLIFKPKNYWGKLETKNTTGYWNKFNTSNGFENSEWTKYRLTNSLTANISNLPNTPETTLINEYINKSTIKSTIEADTKAKLFKADIKASINSTFDVPLEFVINENKTALRFPGNTKYIVSETSYYNDFDNIIKEYFNTDSTKLGQIIEEYFNDTVISSVSKDKAVFNTNDNYKDISCNSLSLTIDKEAAKKIVNSFSSKLKNDERIVDLAFNFLEKAPKGTDTKIAKEDIAKSIKDFADKFKVDDTNMGDYKTVIYKIYFTNSEKIFARELTDGKEFKMGFSFYKKDGKDNISVVFTDFKGKFDALKFDLEGTFNEYGFDGDAKLEANENSNMNLFNLEWKSNVKDEKCIGYIELKTGLIKVNLSYDVKVITELKNLIIPVGKYTLNITAMGTEYTTVYEVKEIEKNSKYETLLTFNDLGKILGDEYKNVSFTLKGDTHIEKIDKVDIPDIDDLDTIKAEDVDINKYFGTILQMFGMNTNGSLDLIEGLEDTEETFSENMVDFSQLSLIP